MRGWSRAGRRNSCSPVFLEPHIALVGLPLPLRERVGERGGVIGTAAVAYPSPGSHLAMRSDLPRKGGGEEEQDGGCAQPTSTTLHASSVRVKRNGRPW